MNEDRGDMSDLARLMDGLPSKNDEPYYPSFSQKLAYRERRKEARARHRRMTEQFKRANAAGEEWPRRWSEEQRAAYLRGPDAEARRLQALADEDAESARSEKVEELKKRCETALRRVQALEDAQTYPVSRLWRDQYHAAVNDLRAVRDEFYAWSAGDWQDRILRGWHRPYGR